MNENHNSIIKQVFRKIGIKQGQKVLDFGCGRGYYTIPAAEVVGKEGIVYAVDKDKERLDDVKGKARDRDLANIKILNSSGGTDLALPDNSMDVVLLYDVFWYFDLTSQGLDNLLEEMRRLSRQNGLLSVYPKHIDNKELKSIIQMTGFNFRNRYSGTLLHEGRPEEGILLNFTRI